MQNLRGSKIGDLKDERAPRSHRSKGLNFQGPEGSSVSLIVNVGRPMVTPDTLVPCLEKGVVSYILPGCR